MLRFPIFRLIHFCEKFRKVRTKKFAFFCEMFCSLQTLVAINSFLVFNLYPLSFYLYSRPLIYVNASLINGQCYLKVANYEQIKVSWIKMLRNYKNLYQIYYYVFFVRFHYTFHLFIHLLILSCFWFSINPPEMLL